MSKDRTYGNAEHPCIVIHGLGGQPADGPSLPHVANQGQDAGSLAGDPQDICKSNVTAAGRSGIRSAEAF